MTEPLGWQSMSTAPKTAKWVLLRLPCRRTGSPKEMVVVAHWADGGGEEQPRFKGWFEDDGYSFREVHVEPNAWAAMPAGTEPR